MAKSYVNNSVAKIQLLSPYRRPNSQILAQPKLYFLLTYVR